VLRRDKNAPVPATSFVTGDKFTASIKIVPHDALRQLADQSWSKT